MHNSGKMYIIYSRSLSIMVDLTQLLYTSSLLLGVQSSPAPSGFLIAPCNTFGLADWELDRLMWSRTVENVATVATTITSLAQLLDQIGNIVINDNIAQEVRLILFH